jgi:hypothetical protein
VPRSGLDEWSPQVPQRESARGETEAPRRQQLWASPWPLLEPAVQTRGPRDREGPGRTARGREEGATSAARRSRPPYAPAWPAPAPRGPGRPAGGDYKRASSGSSGCSPSPGRRPRRRPIRPHFQSNLRPSWSLARNQPYSSRGSAAHARGGPADRAHAQLRGPASARLF